MFYKIAFEKLSDISVFFNTLKDLGNLVYTSQLLYLSSKVSKQVVLDALKTSVPNDTQFMVIEVSENNLAQQPESIQHKFREEKIRFEKERFEAERQEALREYNKFMDNVERELNKQLKEKKKGGQNSAELSQKTKTTDAEGSRPV